LIFTLRKVHVNFTYRTFLADITEKVKENEGTFTVKKALLIAAGLMAINLPVNAAQVNQVNGVNQADQANVSQQDGPIQTETNVCKRYPNGTYQCW
jgi:hypothetical protein